MSLIVQKFGGTSLDTAEHRLLSAEKIKQTIENGNMPVVIVSAMGRKGMPYATDTLLNLARKDSVDICGRESDMLCSCGEIISAVAMVQTLKSLQIEAASLTGAQAGIITDENYCRSNILKIIPNKINEILKKKKVPVIAGFQGSSENGEITTFGRGGSDTSASIIAAALNAELIEIFTDVKGVMTADPQVVKTAQLLEKADYSEILEMANEGARVVHPRAIEVAAAVKIPLKIRSNFDNAAGTLVTNFKPDKIISAVTSRDDIVFIKLENNGQQNLQIFSLLAKKGISADFIDIIPEQITFVIDRENKKVAMELLQNLPNTIEERLSKVSVIGAGMTGIPGVMAKIIEILQKNGIKIYQATDSHTTISCLIAKKDKNRAVKALHSAFCIEMEDSE